MNTKTKKSMLILSMIFLILISTNIISANELDIVNDTTTTNENTNIEISTNELYVNSNVEKTGDGSNNLPFKTLKEAIDIVNTANNPMKIYIHKGTYNETNITIKNSLVITSYEGAATLNANNNGWFFYSNNSANTLSLNGLIFKNGVNYDYYDSTIGGVVKTEGHLDVVNCKFEHNFGGTGGGINSHNGANIINSTFINNKAEYNGAGAYVIYGQTNVVNCTFINNTAKRQGGALRIQGNTYIENSTFKDNYAGTGNYAGNGGAVRVTDGNLTIESSIFKNNSAKFEGGAVSAGDDRQYSTTHYAFNVNNCTFTENRARHGAGIIANDGISMTNSILVNNSVPESISAKYGNGAGIYVLNGNSILVGNIIANNTNKYNRESIDVFTNEGNISEKDNIWGSTSKYNTNKGVKTNEVTNTPTITKPTITIENGDNFINKNIPIKEDENQNTPTQPTTQENSTKPLPTDGNQNTPIENTTENTVENTTENNTIIEDIINQITNTADNIKQQISQNNNNPNPKNESNQIKTNSTTKQSSSNNDLGDKSQTNSQSDANAQSEASAHEISPIKSIATNQFTIPGIILIIIVALAFIIGYLRKRDE